MDSSIRNFALPVESGAFEAVIGFLEARVLVGLDHVDRDPQTGRLQGYHRSIARGCWSGLLSLEQRQTPTVVTVTLSWRDQADPDWDPVPWVQGRLGRFFDQTRALDDVNAHLSQDPLLAPLVAARPGLRLPGAWDPFEMAIRAILGQQVTVKAAGTLTSRIIQRCGGWRMDPAEREQERDEGSPITPGTRLFPSPQALVDADLDGLGITGARIRTIKTVSEAALADPGLMVVSDLRPWPERRAALLALKGIGPWTVDYLGMRAFGEADCFPAADIGLINALALLTGQKPTKAELTARADPWAPYRSYAALHLWHALPSPKAPQ